MTPDRLLIANPVSGKADIMTEHSLWRFSRALHRAINERQLEDVEALIDELYGTPDDVVAKTRRVITTQ